MSEAMSSSVDDFIEIESDDDAMSDNISSESQSSAKQAEQMIDSRRRLEARLAERQLEKDIREFDFDL